MTEKTTEAVVVPLGEIAPEVLSRGGTITFSATGGSMWPHIRPGDTVTTRPLGPGQEPRRGWIIIYRTGADRLAVHRVTGTAGGSLRVRGDALTGAHERVPRAAVLGRAVMVRRKGRTYDLTSSAGAATGYLIAWSGSMRVHLERLSRRLLNALRKR